MRRAEYYESTKTRCPHEEYIYMSTILCVCIQLSKMTEKVQKLSKGLATEKATADQLQKTVSDRSTQQIAENRKLALEISKLKVTSM